jgi:hypothetical protein
MLFDIRKILLDSLQLHQGSCYFFVHRLGASYLVCFLFYWMGAKSSFVEVFSLGLRDDDLGWLQDI